ncbi:MAG: glycerate kinase [Actinomycetaceae bacterium]|nr:glycerate kinase [Actinomycetaceae bacterium]
MKILLAYGHPFTKRQCRTFIDGWHEISPCDYFELVPYEATKNTLDYFWPEGEELFSLQAETSWLMGCELRGIMDSYRCGAAATVQEPLFVYAKHMGKPDGGYHFLCGLHSHQPHRCHHEDSQQCWQELLGRTRQLVIGLQLHIFCANSEHILGLDGALTRYQKSIRYSDGTTMPGEEEVKFPGDSELYQELHGVSRRLRQAAEYGKQKESVLSSAQPIAVDKKEVKQEKQGPSLLTVVPEPVAPGRVAGGATAGGGVEVLSRLGVKVELLEDAVDRLGNFEKRIAQSDLVIATAEDIDSWTIDDIAMSRLVNVNSHIGRPIIGLVHRSSVSRRELGDHGIDGVSVTRIGRQAMPEEQRLHRAGVRCARTWSHMV